MIDYGNLRNTDMGDETHAFKEDYMVMWLAQVWEEVEEGGGGTGGHRHEGDGMMI